MEGLFALLPLIGKVAPLITGMTSALGSPVAGTILAKAEGIAKTIFGTTDMKDIELQIQEDKSKLERFKLELEANTQEDLAFVKDAQDARNMTLELARSGSKMAWGAPAMSFLVSFMFMMVAVVILWINFDTLGEYQKTTIGIIIGYIGSAFNQSVSFWLGSTRNSKDKDNILASLASQGTQAAAQSVPASVAFPSGRMFR
jgi:hypothetical protein